jgi:hypothetical protein
MKIWKPLQRLLSRGAAKREREDLTGQIARSVSGRDEGTLYVIVGKEDGIYVTVCDGERRTVSVPKRKNVRHLMMTGRRVPDGFITRGVLTATDEQIRSFLHGCDEI